MTPARRRGWIAAAALAVVLAAFLPLAGALRRQDAGVPVHRLEPTDFTRRIAAEGTLQAVRATQITVPMAVPGPFRIGWLAEDGAPVKAGETVLGFDPTEIEKQLVEAQDELATARFEATKEQAESLAEIDKLQRDLELARLELDNAKQFLKRDAEVYSRHEILESEIDQALVGRRAKHAGDSRRSREALSGTARDLIRIKMRKAEQSLGRARQGLAALAVKAPHDGVLVLKKDWRGETAKAGDTAWQGQPIAEIPDLSKMQAEVFVLEADAGGLEPGRPATVVLESHPETEFRARIARVDALAKPRVRRSPVQYFGVTLELDRTDPRIMKPGQRVRATLHLDERKGALVLPRQAVFESEGKLVAYRQTRRSPDGFEPVEVTLGPSGMGRVVVESGLAAGDVVAMTDPTRPAGEPEEEEGEETPSASGAAPVGSAAP